MRTVLGWTIVVLALPVAAVLVVFYVAQLIAVAAVVGVVAVVAWWAARGLYYAIAGRLRR